MADTVLLADDSDTMRRVAQMTLAEQGFHVISVSDGQQALDAIDAERPSVALLSVTLQKLDGFALARAIRERPDAADTPVLLLAGAFEPIDDERVRESGAAGVLVKPYEPGLVIKRVKELLGMSKGPDAAADDAAVSSLGGRLVTSSVTPGDAPGSFAGQADGSPAAHATQTSVGSHDGVRETSPAQARGGGHTPAPLSTIESMFDNLESHLSNAPAAPPATVESDRPIFEVEPNPFGRRQESLDAVGRDIGRADLPAWSASGGADLPPPVTQQASFPPATVRGALGGRIPAADAFAALLAVEQGEAPPAMPAGANAFDLSDETIAHLSSRIVEQLAERTSIGLAERLATPLGTRLGADVSARVVDAVGSRIVDDLPGRIADALPSRLADALAERLAPALAERLSAGLAERVGELVAERVMRSALGDQLRQTVHDVSERLVREEIDRIRQRAASR